VVIDYFLGHYYDPHDPTLPPLGTVVTLSSPHAGAPLATAGAELRGNPVTGAALDQIEGHTSIPPTNSPAVRELSEQSQLVKHLWDRGVPEHFDFTTIGATEDLVVPPTQIGVPGSDETVVAGHGLSQHHGIVTDPDALRAVRAALEGRPLPCVSLVTALRAAVAPVLVTRMEHTVGDAASPFSLGGS
jgi:hypothetical protein